MPRYYFNIRDDSGVSEDGEGVELDGLQSAREEAQQSARELIAEAVKANKKIDNRQIEIIDEQGSLIECFKFRDLLD